MTDVLVLVCAGAQVELACTEVVMTILSLQGGVQLRCLDTKQKGKTLTAQSTLPLKVYGDERENP